MYLQPVSVLSNKCCLVEHKSLLSIKKKWWKKFKHTLEITLAFFVCVCLQKRRSNRKVKRKKYEDDGEARLSDEDMKVIVKAKKTNSNAQKHPAVQLFVVST